MTELSGFKGKLALVTGAGDGIGEMLAKGFAHAGLRVCVQDIREDAAQRVAGEIGDTAFAVGGDVSDRDSMQAVADDLAARGETLNLLWLNAGVGAGSPVLKGKPSTVSWAYGVNVLGIIWSAQAFVPLLEAATSEKHVGFTASSASLRAPTGDFPLYAATKHGTFSIAEAIASELKTLEINSTILCPGLLNTDIWDAARARPDRFGGTRRMDPKISTYWREAQDPDVMWPHIARKIDAGGGYLVCATDRETATAFEARARDIQNSIVELISE